MKELLFLERSKLADLIAANYNLILMLPRFGISLGFGDKSVREICENHNVPTDFFLFICSIYSSHSFIPSREMITTMDMRFLLPYLLSSHRYYKEERLPHIEKNLHVIIGQSDEKYSETILHFFNEYKEEMKEHFLHEEEHVFPHLQALQEGFADNSYRIGNFALSHSNIEDKLNDLIQIIFKYFPGNVYPNQSIELVFDLLRFSYDLDKHKFIEEKVLVPYVEHLERRLS